MLSLLKGGDQEARSTTDFLAGPWSHRESGLMFEAINRFQSSVDDVLCEAARATQHISNEPERLAYNAFRISSAPKHFASPSLFESHLKRWTKAAPESIRGGGGYLLRSGEIFAGGLN